MGSLLAAASIFFLLHMLPSTPARPFLAARLGEGVYSAVFSVLSLVAIWWLVSAYARAPYGGKLWEVPEWWPWLKLALVMFALVLVFGGLLTPNPSSPGAGKVLQNPHAADGIFALTRHPVMWGIAIWALAHLISQGTVRGFLFFGCLAATALIGSWLQQRRKRASLAGWAAFEAKTSFIPFAALFDGRAGFSFKTVGWWKIAIGIIVGALAVHFHLWLFGVQPLPVYT